jgi:hypothetical protein
MARLLANVDTEFSISGLYQTTFLYQLFGSMELTFFGTVLWARRDSGCVESATWLENPVLYSRSTATIISAAI